MSNMEYDRGDVWAPFSRFRGLDCLAEGSSLDPRDYLMTPFAESSPEIGVGAANSASFGLRNANNRGGFERGTRGEFPPILFYR